MTGTTEHVELERWAPTRDETLVWLSIMLLAFVPIGAIFAGFASLATGGGAGEVRIELGSFVLFLVLILAIFVLHEVIHGATVLLFGQRPRFGAGLMHGLPYLSTTADAEFARDQFVVIALAPLAVISVAGVGLMFLTPALSAWLVFPLALNALGTIGDLALVRVALRYPRSVVIQDEQTGITVRGPSSYRRRPLSAGRNEAARERFVRAFSRAFPIVLLVILVLELVLVVALQAAGVSSFELPGFVAVSRGASPRVSAGLFGPLAVALGLAVAYAGLKVGRR